MTETKTITIGNYHALKLIHKSDRTLVYRGQNVENGQPVIIKLMRNQYPSFRELVQFRNQYAISKNLEIEGIIKTYTLERYENRYALIMEDMGGVSLAEYQGRASLSVSQFLDLAIQLSKILHQLHNNSIIHKDIKPANILIHPETKQVKLIDFSISSLLPKETQVVETPNVLEGTLAYISPEQTGRMNRAVDYRSDFYSLGVTFYELLMGALPFRTDDALEVIHGHIALYPKPLSELVVLGGCLCPPTISDIVMKLMAKNAEYRYQSALGLKYDLEKCLSQYQERGKIESFELGERDICDRFLIPEKLYGREKEVQALLDAFERVVEGNREMVMVAGFSGIGKTAVVNEVHKPIVKQRGYFIKGKFDQFNRNVPFSAFVQAFRSLMGQIISESDAQLQEWKTQILEAVGNNGQVLIDVIPELEMVIGKQPPVPQLSGSATQNRFNLLFEKFIAVFTTKEHPLVIFLDDLQWADSASLNLMKVLMGNSKTRYLLLLGAYRDNEVFPAHPLMLTLADLQKQSAGISTITLAPLSVHHINQLVAETMSCQVEQSQPLTELVDQKTQGNPFFTTQFLKGLYEDELIVFNRNFGYWECDLVKVRDASLTDDVVEFMAGRFQKLPEGTQEVLKLAACIGNQFDLETLAVVCETPSEEVASRLWSALQEGMVLPISEAYKFFQGDLDSDRIPTSVGYRFLHDRVQQAAYFLIEEEKKSFTHYKIGKLLLKKDLSNDKNDDIFTIVDQLNHGVDLIETSEEKLFLAQLNEKAAQKAKKSTAYGSASEYLKVGRSLLPPNYWKQEYELAFTLTIAAMEVAYLNTDFVTARQLGILLLSEVKTISERAKVDEISIQVEIAGNNMLEAVDLGLKTLEVLGFPLVSPEVVDRGIELPTLRELEQFPIMENDVARAAMNILMTLVPPTFVATSLFPQVVVTMLQISLSYGRSPLAAYAYSIYGWLLSGAQGQIEAGYQAGELALKLQEMFMARELECKVNLIIYAHIQYWKKPLKDSLQPLLKTMTIGLDVGDLEYAGYAAMHYCHHLIWVGENLATVNQQQKQTVEFIDRYLGQAFCQEFACIWWQLVANLEGKVDDIHLLVGEHFNEEERLPILEEASNHNSLVCIYLAKSILSYLLEDYTKSVEYATQAGQHTFAIPGVKTVAIHNFIQSLAELSVYSSRDTSERNSILERISTNQEKMKNWATQAPINFQHKYELVEAEKYRVLGQTMEAMEQYDLAILGAKENGYIQEEALANELAAKFYLDWGKEKFATLYLQEAYYCYAQWGAKAKVKDLEVRYPQLLKPIRQRDRTSLSSNTSISKITSNSYSQTASVANISSILDFSSLLKASQTLSGEIELKRLLSTVMKIILENAGATKGGLLLIGEQGLTIEALANRTGDNSKLTIDSLNQSIPLEDTIDLPVGLINYVRRTTETALLDAVAAQEQFAADRYLLRFHPQSLLCMPLQERGKLIGILYLENSLTADAFTQERLEILDTLCVQAVISLENARLYQQAQQTLKDLQAAQLQLVQSEKMATLGNLVAGVAHEINNPLGFIKGNINAGFEHLQDLLTILSIYEENTSLPESIIAEIEALEPEFIAEDFPKLMASMQEGCERIRKISKSLRTFSRTDTDAKTEFNLHDGIDSTLLILKYRLKANQNRPAIEIIKNYGNIPLVKCYAGQINQVFMNLLANAIDALDESNEGKTFQEIEKEPNRITIATEFSEESKQVIVRITDNGTGMPEEVKARLFEQGFTTKGVGKGTGLGMAIAHQIITEKHGGQITCNSTLEEGTIFTLVIPK